MIPDFKTFIGESVWADIHRRSNGSQERKEDDINLLDGDGFYEYLINNYKQDDMMFVNIENIKDTSSICIPFCSFAKEKNVTTVKCLWYEYDEKVVYVDNLLNVHCPHLWNKLDEDFDLWKDEPDYEGYTIINPKNQENVSDRTFNTYVLRLLDYILDNLDKTVIKTLFKKNNESVWADIHRRSNGSQERKEDDINKLDFDDFFEYLKDIYVHIKPSSFWVIGKYEEPGMQGEVQTILFPVESNVMGSISIKKNVKKNYFYPIVMKHKFLEQYETDLYNTFYLTKDSTKMSGYIINKNTCEILPHDGHITNEICIDVIDKILGIVENPIFKKVE